MDYHPSNIIRIHKEWGMVSEVTVTYRDGRAQKTTAYDSWVNELIRQSGKHFRLINEPDQTKTWEAEDVDEE